jgi:hypothetical protein
VIVGVTWVRCPGCLDRSRLNENCNWTGDTAFPLDPSNPTHQQRLVHDAQLAEDLATRYADAEHLRLYGFNGHGGQIEHGRLVKECATRLFATIENNHSVSGEQVQAARPVRNLAFDAGVWLSFLLLYFLAVVLACRWPDGAFGSGELQVRLSAIGDLPRG